MFSDKINFNHKFKIYCILDDIFLKKIIQGHIG